MGNRTMRGAGYLILLTLICGLAGGFIGEAIGDNIKALSFMGKYLDIGMQSPLILNLKVLRLTLGIGFSVNILSLVGMLLGYYIYTKM